MEEPLCVGRLRSMSFAFVSIKLDIHAPNSMTTSLQASSLVNSVTTADGSNQMVCYIDSL